MDTKNIEYNGIMDETEFEKALREILESDVRDIDSTSEELLLHYEKKTGKDFEEEYRSEREVAIKEKIEQEIADGDVTNEEGRSDYNIEERQRNVEDTVDEALDGEEIDEETKKEAKKEVEKQDKSGELSKQEIRALAMKSVYKKVLKDYAKDMLSYKKWQLKNENITTYGVNRKDAVKAIMARKYLNNIEKSYKNYAAYYNLDEKELKADPEIKKMIDEFENEVKDYDKSNDKKVSKNLDKIERLHEKRRDLSEKMKNLSTNRDDYAEEMNALQEEYLAVSYELTANEPSLEDYERQIQTGKDVEKIAEEYEISPVRGGTPSVTANGNVKESYEEEYLEERETSKKTDQIGDETRFALIEDIEVELSHIKELMKNYEQNEKEITKALESIELRLGVEYESREYANGNNDNLQNERPNSDSSRGFMDEYNDQVRTPEQAVINQSGREKTEARINNIEDLLREQKGLDVSQKEQNVMIRTRKFNN